MEVDVYGKDVYCMWVFRFLQEASLAWWTTKQHTLSIYRVTTPHYY